MIRYHAALKKSYLKSNQFKFFYDEIKLGFHKTNITFVQNDFIFITSETISRQVVVTLFTTFDKGNA